MSFCVSPDFLEGFYTAYGSFIPLHKSDVLRHLRRKYNSDFSDRYRLNLSQMRLLDKDLKASPCLSVQEKPNLLRGGQAPNFHRPEIRPLFPSRLQEAHTDTGRLVDAG